MEFDNFESVWQRVTAQDEELPLPAPTKENKREEKLCVIKRSQKSCAVRFVAGQLAAIPKRLPFQSGGVFLQRNVGKVGLIVYCKYS